MSAYVVARVRVTDKAAYERYTKMVPETLEPYGGRYLVRGGAVEAVEGSAETRRVVVLEFPTFEGALAWHTSGEYAAAKRLREESAETDMMIVEGLGSTDQAGGREISPDVFGELVAKSRSYRRFRQTPPVQSGTLRELVDLTRLAPTTANRQQLKYLLITGEEPRDRIFPTLRWAAALVDWPGPAEAERPTGYIVILGDTAIAADFDRDYPIAAQTIMLGAASRGLGGCMIHNVERGKLRAALEVDERYEILLVLALGSPAEEVAVEPMPADGSTTYWRDDAGVHHVPKRSLGELIVREL